MIERRLVRAYRETSYTLPEPHALALRIDVPNPALAALHARCACESSAFVTACNPHSRPLGDAENRLRGDALEDELRRSGRPFFEGKGEHPTNGWPAEPGFLVLGISLDDAKAIGARHDQNAIVWCGSDAVPRLILLR